MSIKHRQSLHSVLLILCIVSLFFCGCSKKPYIPNVISKNASISVGKSTIYYTSDISDDELKSLKDYLTESKLFIDGDVMELDKHGDAGHLLWLYAPHKAQAKYYQQAAQDVSHNVFNDSGVSILLCNDKFLPVEMYSSNSYDSKGK